MDRFGYEPTDEERARWEELSRDVKFVRSFSVQLSERAERSFPRRPKRVTRREPDPDFFEPPY